MHININDYIFMDVFIFLEIFLLQFDLSELSLKQFYSTSSFFIQLNFDKLYCFMTEGKN